MGAVTSSSVQITITRGEWGHYSYADIDRISANKLIAKAMREMGHGVHGWKMIAQMLTEAVCMRGESKAVFAFGDGSEETNIIVER